MPSLSATATADAANLPIASAARARLAQQGRAAFLAGIPGELQTEAAARYDRHVDTLLSRLQALYGDRADFGEWVCRFMTMAGHHHAVRSEALRQLDRERSTRPDWFLDPSMLGYCAYVDRFAGTLTGVAQRIPYLRELGVRYLHLLPFLRMRRGDNDGGFAVASFDEVEPSLGSMDDLVALTTQLREAGISLCADFVLNHVADDHPWALAASLGDARHRGYFRIFADREMPDLYERTAMQVFPAVAPGNFTFRSALGGWVWTSFYPYQWDLNYENPLVFGEMANALLSLANRGIEVFRLDSAPFLWKRLGSACTNQPEVHWLLQAFRALVDIVAPGVLLKAEAIVPVEALPPYFASADGRVAECHLAYHSGLMAASWAAMAEQRTDLLRRVIEATPALPSASSWLTYVRCHDDIVWSTLAPATQADAQDFHARLLPVSDFLAGRTPGSYADGERFQADDDRQVFGTNGMAASLVGLGSAIDAEQIAAALNRLRLLYGLAMCFGGLPLIYMGDELAQLNDRRYETQSLREADGRWLQRVPLDEYALSQRHQPATLAGRACAMLRELQACRTGLSALAADRPRRLVAVDDRALLVLQRGEHFVAVLNFSAQLRTLLREQLLDGLTVQGWRDAESGEPLDVQSVSLMPWGMRWFVRPEPIAPKEEAT